MGPNVSWGWGMLAWYGLRCLKIDCRAHGTQMFVVVFAVECSQPGPDLSNSFLNILLPNNTVCGVVRLGY